MRDDGLCYEAPAADDTGAGGDDTGADTEPPTVEDLVDALPACEPASTDGRLDIYAGCADGLCPGMTYDQAVAAAGEPSRCYGFYYEIDGYVGGSLDCSWGTGVSLDFDDTDRDGVADPGSSSFGVSLTASYEGGTDTGLGMGANLACFVDELGYPSYVSFEAIDKEWLVGGMAWDDHGVYAYDSQGPRDSYEPDGYVDRITLYGSDVTF